MTKTPSDICEDIGFSFILRRYGWSDLYIVLADTAVEIGITHVFNDPETELLELCNAVLNNVSTTIALYDEPGRHVISLTSQPQQHTMLLEILEGGSYGTGDAITGNEKILASARVKRKQLLGLAMAELWKLRFFLRDPSYQKARAGNFPSDRLEALNAEWDVHKTLGPSFLK
ncbi:hypothetical protein ABAC460_21770 [Asticcacaulis sp. AC460]|uniref:hypothetical protein n=1 Tax=Asticcacaulis sp. AC460 TaxID=1282360 RepID=UPI0003C3D259|nr:hypothetical protein [Asticcacaulis sp. AC460]ESQ86848.1 hypothetical protein ABAC460_21770 [Asticcacaulis sp. AC460]